MGRGFISDARGQLFRPWMRIVQKIEGNRNFQAACRERRGSSNMGKRMARRTNESTRNRPGFQGAD